MQLVGSETTLIVTLLWLLLVSTYLASSGVQFFPAIYGSLFLASSMTLLLLGKSPYAAVTLVAL